MSDTWQNTQSQPAEDAQGCKCPRTERRPQLCPTATLCPRAWPLHPYKSESWTNPTKKDELQMVQTFNFKPPDDKLPSSSNWELFHCLSSTSWPKPNQKCCQQSAVWAESGHIPSWANREQGSRAGDETQVMRINGKRSRSVLKKREYERSCHEQEELLDSWGTGNNIWASGFSFP